MNRGAQVDHIIRIMIDQVEPLHMAGDPDVDVLHLTLGFKMICSSGKARGGKILTNPHILAGASWNPS